MAIALYRFLSDYLLINPPCRLISLLPSRFHPLSLSLSHSLSSSLYLMFHSLSISFLSSRCRWGKFKVYFVLTLTVNRNALIKCGWTKWNQRITFLLIYRKGMILQRSSTLLVIPKSLVFCLLFPMCPRLLPEI